MKKRSSRKDTRIFGLLFWIGALSLVLIVFFLNKAEISRVLESTGFSDVFQSEIEKPVEIIISPPSELSQTEELPARETPEPTIEAPEAEEAPENKPVEEFQAAEEEQSEVLQEEPQAPAEQVIPRTRRTRLYYIRLLDGGEVIAESVDRDIVYSTSPLTDTLRVLLKGPTTEEIEKGFLNLIPHDTELHSVWIEDSVAHLNFNEAFLFNAAGMEGTIAQIQQIVLSTLQFPTISSVQILIDGRKVEYLSEEGIYIGKPLSRETPLIQKTES